MRLYITARNLYQFFRTRFYFSVGKLWFLAGYLSFSGNNKTKVNSLRSASNKIFFVTGSGRSGTQLLTHLLGLSDNTKVFHEPNFFQDVAAMERARSDYRYANSYVCKYRMHEIYKRWHAGDVSKSYGEVNGTIRYLVPHLKSILPNAPIILVARDGRGFVRSLMGWPQFYSEKSSGAYAISPLTGDPYYDKWKNMTRFEKICWSWMETNEFLMNFIPKNLWLNFESIVSDYNYFFNNLVRPLGLEIEYAAWKQCISMRSPNSSSQYSFPSWEDWTVEQRSQFIAICGGTMLKLGYKI